MQNKQNYFTMQFSRSITLLLLLSLYGCSQLSWIGGQQPVKSQSDSRDYRYMTLDNGLQLLLISDMQAKKAAASLDVFVGSAQNPETRLGMAHFLEHMLFLGTEKYPNAGEYQSFIADNGGSHNAYTSFEHTNYFFDVTETAFEPALDRFAQFFIAPLFDAQYLEREKHAVHAEYRAGIKSDERRQLDVLREVVNPEHPFSLFSVGNLATLSGDADALRDEMLAFYRQYYAAENMRLVVLAPRNLDQLAAEVERLFSPIAQAEVPAKGYAEPLFAAADLPKWVNIKPEKNQRSLSILFPLEDQQSDYPNQSLNIVGHVLGHEGEQSLFAYLKSRHWVNSLVAGQALNYEGVTVLSLSVELTESGERALDQVVAAIFATINQTRQSGIPATMYQEVAAINQLDFDYQDQAGEMQTVMRLSNAMHYYAANDLLRAPYMYEAYQPDKINAILAAMTPRNALFIHSSPTVKTDQRSRYYATPYAVARLTEPFITQLENTEAVSDIALPKINPYIPQNTSILPINRKQQQQPPQQLDLAGNNAFTLWYKGVDAFKQPKLNTYHYLYPAEPISTLSQSLKLSLYARLLNDTLNPFLYDVNMAGVTATVQSYQSGLSIQTSGFSDKQALLLPRLIQRYQAASFDAMQFARLKTALQNDLKNSQKSMPYRQLLQRWRAEMQSNVWPIEDSLAALEDIQLDDINQFKQRFWQRLNVEALYNGNISESQARTLAEQLRPILVGDAAVHAKPGFQVADLSAAPSQWLPRNIDHNDAAYLLYWQAAGDSLAETATWLILANVLEPGYFHQLRTEEQLGYIVFESYYPLWRKPGLMFVVQAPEAGVEAIHRSTFAYLDSQFSRLNLIGDSQLATYKQALISNLTQPPKSLAEQSQYFQRSLFYQAADQQQTFKRKQQLVAAIEQVDAATWRGFIQDLKNQAYANMLLLSTHADDGVALAPFGVQRDKVNAPAFISYPESNSESNP
ncbi:MAG: insulinase family protein [Pseudomonadales bacterium]|nr:insulinase family protein [Pseudomonadales bacterium]